MLRTATDPKTRWPAWLTLVLAFCLSCSAGVDTHRGSAGKSRRGPSQPRFRSPEMDAMYKAAKASPRSFDPVYAYAKAVADACLASLAFPCDTCGEGALRYKQRSELEPQYWPIIEEALSMLDVLGKTAALTVPERVELLIATKGRLLWLVGRSVEEQPMIDEYAKEHPGAVAVIRRRLELLRESNDVGGFESQCTRSRARTESAPEGTRVDLLTACVALHPRNTYGRSDLLDYSKYLPNLTASEETVYRKSLVDRCEARASDEEESCAEGCGCEDKDSGKLSGKCKRACGRCRSEMGQRLRLCKKITEAPTAVVRPRPAPAPPVPVFTPTKTNAHDETPRPKRDTGKGLKPVEL